MRRLAALALIVFSLVACTNPSEEGGGAGAGESVPPAAETPVLPDY